MTSINFHAMLKFLKLKSLKLRSVKPGSWTGRSARVGVLTLMTSALVTVSFGTVAPSPASAQSLTWQNALAKLFGRQPQKGGTRGPLFCSVTPMSYRALPDAKSPRVFNSVSQRLLSDRPMIVWYGTVGLVKIRNRTTKTEQLLSPTLVPTTIEDDSKKLDTKELALQKARVLYQAQDDAQLLLPDQEYELVFMSAKDPKDTKSIPNVLESYRFRTLSQADRNRLNRQLKDLATAAAKTNSDPVLPQVEFLLEQNLVNDAQMLILQQSDPSPELKNAIAATRNPCEVRFGLKAPNSKN